MDESDKFIDYQNKVMTALDGMDMSIAIPVLLNIVTGAFIAQREPMDRVLNYINTGIFHAYENTDEERAVH